MAFTYSKLSIKRKLQVIIMAIVVAVLFLCSAAFATYDLIALRNSLRGDLQTLAEIVGANSTAALSFGDEDTARELLSGLSARRHLAAACLYSAESKPFATYRRVGAQGNSSFPQPGPEGSRFGSSRLILFHHIRLNDRPIGTVYLESDLEELHCYSPQTFKAPFPHRFWIWRGRPGASRLKGTTPFALSDRTTMNSAI